MSVNSERVMKARVKRKTQIVEVMGGECALCGYSKTQNALEMHHILPEEKELAFGKMSSFPNWEILKKELKKCIILCANCHREVHDISLNVPDLISSYNEEKATKFQEELKPTLYLCSVCQSPLIWGKTKTGMCEVCAHKATRLVERPSRIELKYLIRNIPFTKIGEKYHVSDNAIRKWCKTENLPNKSKEIKIYTDKEWELL